MTAVVYANVNLLPYQVQLPNGTILGQKSDVMVQKIAGLRDMPQLRTTDAPRGMVDGSFPGFNLLGERAVTVDWLIAKPSGSTESAIQQLTAGWQNIIDPSTVVMRAGDYLRQYAGVGATLPVSMLQVQLPGRTYPLVTFGRPSRLTAPIDTNYQYGWVSLTSEWVSPEGVLYDGTIFQATATLTNPVSGLTFNATPNFVFGTSSGGSITLTNSGNYQTPPYFTIQGPCSNPSIVNNTTGQWMKLNLTLGATDTVAIDMQSGAVTLNGTANRNNTVDPSSTFFYIPPGSTSLSFTSSDSAQVNGALNAYLMPAYSTI